MKNHISLQLEQLVAFKSRLWQSLVGPGEMIGYAAAQPIGDKTTHMIKIQVWQTLQKR